MCDYYVWFPVFKGINQVADKLLVPDIPSDQVNVGTLYGIYINF